MGAATGVLIGLSAVSKVIGISQQQRAANAQISELKRRKTEFELQATQQQLSETQQIREVLGTQTALAGANAITAGSTTYKSIQRDSYSQFLLDEKQSKLNVEAQKAVIDQQIYETRQGANAAIIGGVLDIASNSVQSYGSYQQNRSIKNELNVIQQQNKTLGG